MEKYKHEADPGDYFQMPLDCCTFTMMRDSSILRIVDNDVPLSDEPRVVKIWDKERKIWGGYRYIDCPQSMYMYKSFYGMVDVHNGLRARYGLDWKTNRKMFRITSKWQSP